MLLFREQKMCKSFYFCRIHKAVIRLFVSKQGSKLIVDVPLQISLRRIIERSS